MHARKPQLVNISREPCFVTPEVLSEIGSAFVKRHGMAYNFDKYTLSDIQHLDAPYDYSSVMHYGSHAFAKGYGPTIVPKKPASLLGQRNGLSDIDIWKINKLYNCPGIKPLP